MWKDLVFDQAGALGELDEGLLGQEFIHRVHDVPSRREQGAERNEEVGTKQAPN
jgi:hypothetical protein